MKTLSRFEHNCCTIKYLKQTRNEAISQLDHQLYKIVVTPKNNNTWRAYGKEFSYSKDAEMYMLEQIKFWLS